MFYRIQKNFDARLKNILTITFLDFRLFSTVLPVSCYIFLFLRFIIYVLHLIFSVISRTEKDEQKIERVQPRQQKGERSLLERIGDKEKAAM